MWISGDKLFEDLVSAAFKRSFALLGRHALRGARVSIADPVQTFNHKLLWNVFVNSRKTCSKLLNGSSDPYLDHHLAQR